MNYTSKVKNILNSCIEEISQCKEKYLVNPEKDFSRTKKLSFESTIKSLIAMGGQTLSKEIMDIWDYKPNLPTSSAFVQRRSQIKSSRFKDLFDCFNRKISQDKLYMGKYHLIAVDGSDIAIAYDKFDTDSFNINQAEKPVSMLHINAAYDLMNNRYTDIIIQKRAKENEHTSFCKFVSNAQYVDNSAIYIADRGYESYNNFAHIIEANQYFLIRIKDINSHNSILEKFHFPDEPFDKHITMKLSKKGSKDIVYSNDPSVRWLPSNSNFDFLDKPASYLSPAEFYLLPVRFVRFQISDNSYELIATNLPDTVFTPDDIKILYNKRWGIETSFRNLKYSIGLSSFHAKKRELIYQEIFARLLFFNFSQIVISHLTTRNLSRKFAYMVNFSDAIPVLRRFFLDKLAPDKTDTLILKFTSPIRPGRNDLRKLKTKGVTSFIYRIA